MKCNLLRTGSFTLATTIILCTFAHKELKAQGAGNMLTKANIEAALNAAYDQFKNIGCNSGSPCWNGLKHKSLRYALV